jgi:signal transduction histidine kinase
VTERKQAQAQRIELELQRERVLLLNRFMMDASHDLRTPITIMKTSLHLVKRVTDPEKQTRYITRLEEGLEQLHRLIENLFTLVRLDMAASTLDLKPGDLNVLAEIVYLERRDLAEQRKHTLRLRGASNLPKVMLDLKEFVPALSNLVTNALNYTPEGGEITVETAFENQQVLVRVRDNGIGISAEHLPHIFERFYRVDPARGADTGGSGVGLTIAQKIVQAHGGQIRVESTPGQGSVFTIYLPVPAENGVAVTLPNARD